MSSGPPSSQHPHEEGSLLLNATTEPRFLRCQRHTVAKDGFANEVWTLPDDAGTHLVPPSGVAVAEVGVEQLVGAAVVVGEEHVASVTPRPLVFVKSHMTTAAHLRVSWPRSWDGIVRLVGTDAAKLTLHRATSTGEGTEDTPGAGFGPEGTCRVQRARLPHVADANAAEGRLCFAYVLPLRIQDASCSPARVAFDVQPTMGVDELAATRAVDCTHVLHHSVPVFPGAQRLYACPATASGAGGAEGAHAQTWITGSDTGTHVDSPAHFFPDGHTIDQLPLDSLIVPGVVIDVTDHVFANGPDQAPTNPDFGLTADHIVAFEERIGGRIPAGSFVALRTGWEQRFSSTAAYRNAEKPDASEEVQGQGMHFPGFDESAAAVLLERGVAGIGIDTLSLDRGASTEFEVHQAMLGAGKYQVENMRLSQLPATTTATAGHAVRFVCLPIRVEGAQEAQCRVAALVPKATAVTSPRGE